MAAIAVLISSIIKHFNLGLD